MSAPADLPFDLDALPPALREAFAAMQAKVARDALAERNADGRPRRPAAKRTLGHLPDHLPRIEQVIEPAQKICPCGCADMVKIGEDRAERLDIVPARFQVIVTVRPRLTPVAVATRVLCRRTRPTG